MHIRFLKPLLMISTLSFISAGCSSSTTTAASSAVSNAMASLQVSSATAAKTASSSYLENDFGTQMAGEVPDIKPMETMVKELKDTLAAGDPTAVAGKIGAMSITKYNAPCFGPSWTDNARGSSVQRPSGDLGMVANTTSPTDTSACAAGQLNSLIGGYPQFVNKIIFLQTI